MMQRKIAVTVILILTGFWGFLLFKYFEHRSEESYHGSVIKRNAPDFHLMTQNGNRVALSQFKGKAVIMSFGFTQCPDICPTTLMMLKDVLNKLGDSKDRVQVLFVTVDPERDTPKRLKDYVPYFDNSFLGLTGTSQEIANVAESYGVNYFKEYTDSKSGYLMTHTSSVYVIDSKGNLFLEYSPNEFDSNLIAEDIKRIL